MGFFGAGSTAGFAARAAILAPVGFDAPALFFALAFAVSAFASSAFPRLPGEAVALRALVFAVLLMCMIPVTLTIDLHQITDFHDSPISQRGPVLKLRVELVWQDDTERTSSLFLTSDGRVIVQGRAVSPAEREALDLPAEGEMISIDRNLVRAIREML
jgi:hypothetical protein